MNCRRGFSYSTKNYIRLVLVILCICRSTASGRGETWNILWDAHEVGHSSRVVYRNSHQIAKYSKDFRVQWYPEYKRSNNIVPFVSLRDCKRADLRNTGNMAWVIKGNLCDVVPDDVQLRHCLEIYSGSRTSLISASHTPFTIHSKKEALVTEVGIVKTKDETVALERVCLSQKAERASKSITSCAKSTNQTVFVASGFWTCCAGSEYHTFSETFQRILAFVPEIREAKAVIHLSKNAIPVSLRTWFLRYNLTSISGNVCSRHVIVPQEIECRGGDYAASLLLRSRALLGLQDNVNATETTIMVRAKNSRELIQGDKMIASFRARGWTNLQVIYHNNNTFWSCIDCQKRRLQRTKLLIGSHGAALSNMMLFMQPGTGVVEIAVHSRPESPVYSNFAQRANVYSLYYYHYYWHDTDRDMRHLNSTLFINEVSLFVQHMTNTSVSV